MSVLKRSSGKLFAWPQALWQGKRSSSISNDTSLLIYLLDTITMPIFRTNFHGDCNIGLYGFASDRYCFLGVKAKTEKKIHEVLQAKINVSTLLYTSLVSIFAAGNSHGIVVPKISGEYELHELKFRNVLALDTRYTALGNLILMNDSGIIISPLIRRHKTEIGGFFSLPAAVSTVAGLNIIGSAAVATNKGCLAHPQIKENEKKIIEDTLQVPSDIGTVSFGSPFVKSGIIANSRGIVVSDKCSGPELGRINEVFG